MKNCSQRVVRNTVRTRGRCELCRRTRRTEPGSLRWWKRPSPPRPAASGHRELQVHRGAPGDETGNSILAPPYDRLTNEPSDDGVEPGHTLGHRQAEVRMLLSFQRPSPPGGRGVLPEDAPRALRRSGQKSIATSHLGAQTHPTWEARGRAHCPKESSRAPSGKRRDLPKIIRPAGFPLQTRGFYEPAPDLERLRRALAGAAECGTVGAQRQAWPAHCPTGTVHSWPTGTARSRPRTRPRTRPRPRSRGWPVPGLPRRDMRPVRAPRAR